MSTTRMTARIKTLCSGFGFVVGPDGLDRFFHADDLVGVEFWELGEGDHLTFEPVVDAKGLRAHAVSRAEASDIPLRHPDRDADVTTQACRHCRELFTLTAAARAWFIDKGLRLPTRCKPCRRALRDEQTTQPQGGA